MSTYAQVSGLIANVPKRADATTREERWPLPTATLFIVSTSLALWTGIFFLTNAIVG